MSAKKTPNFAPTAIGLFVMGVLPLFVLINRETKTKEREERETLEYYADLERREAIESQERKKDSIAKAKAMVIANPQTITSKQETISNKPVQNAKVSAKPLSAFEQRRRFNEREYYDSLRKKEHDNP